jgi:hypothetical protein
MNDTILFDRLAYIDRLKRSGISDDQARAHADAMDEALRESVATKRDVAAVRDDLRLAVRDLEHKIDLAVRDMTIRAGGMSIALFAALAAIKYFG